MESIFIPVVTAVMMLTAAVTLTRTRVVPAQIITAALVGETQLRVEEESLIVSTVSVATSKLSVRTRATRIG